MASQGEAQDTRGTAAGERRPLFAGEGTLDRAARFHLGAWGMAAVAALAGAILLARMPPGARGQETETADLAQRQVHLVRQVRDGQNEIRRLSAALDVLNADRDCLYARVTVLEQDVASVTGSVKQAQAVPAPPAAPSLLMAALSMPAPLPPIVVPEIVRAAVQPAAAPPAPAVETAVAAAPPAAPSEASPAPAVVPPVPEIRTPRSEFGVDLGSAGSIDGLRALWSGLQKAHGAALDGLRPLMVMKERHGGQGLQLRLVAGPFANAADASRLCAVLATPERPCETAPFDGQRLAPRPERARAPRAVKRPEVRPQASAF